MKSAEDIIKELKKEGYDPVYVWNAEPHEEDPDHTHTFDTHLFVMSGEIKITTDTEEIILKQGSSFGIPREKIHSGKVGAKGCSYIVAEKHF